MTYVRIKTKAETGAMPCGWIYEHVRIVVKAIGHALPVGARIHHVNDVENDNRNNNLCVLQDDAEHKQLHMRRRVLRAGGDPFAQQFCSRCGNVKSFEHFHRRSDMRLGRRSICKSCWHKAVTSSVTADPVGSRGW
jgi:hypothetical protein